MQLHPYFVNGVYTCISVAKNWFLVHRCNCMCPVCFGVGPGMMIIPASRPGFQSRYFVIESK